MLNIAKQQSNCHLCIMHNATVKRVRGYTLSLKITIMKALTDRKHKDECMTLVFSYSLLIHGEPWHPVGEMTSAQKECLTVASYLDVTAIVGTDATKDRFMQELHTSTVIHIGVYNMCVCVCVCVCVRACVRVCVCARASVRMYVCTYVRDVFCKSADPLIYNVLSITVDNANS